MANLPRAICRSAGLPIVLNLGVVSLATVGYVDYTRTTPIARVFTMAFLINCIAILVALFDRIRVVHTQHIERQAER